MNIWSAPLNGWMPVLGLLLGPLLARWVQIAPLWMHARWAQPDDGPAPHPPAWSIRGAIFMGVSTAALWGVCGQLWDGTAAPAWAVFGTGLWLLACIDARSGWLPDVFTLGLLALGLGAAALQIHSTELSDAAWGAVLGHGVLWCTARLFHALSGREGLGGGDPKLLAAIGAWMGWSALAPVVLVASVSGVLVAAAMQGLGRWPKRQAFAFGPFLVLAVPIVGAVGPHAFVVFLPV
jgi:leader peptidase (prepilin peptidase)/N-methyltransferase